jgi:hypothetical protein
MNSTEFPPLLSQVLNVPVAGLPRVFVASCPRGVPAHSASASPSAENRSCDAEEPNRDTLVVLMDAPFVRLRESKRFAPPIEASTSYNAGGKQRVNGKATKKDENGSGTRNHPRTEVRGFDRLESGPRRHSKRSLGVAAPSPRLSPAGRGSTTILGLKSEASALSQQAHGVIPSEAEESPLAGRRPVPRAVPGTSAVGRRGASVAPGTSNP